MSKTKIFLSTYGDRGWQWSIPAGEMSDYRPEPGVTRIHYRTNRRGDGLWVWQPSGTWDRGANRAVYEWKQIYGTGQFSLGRTASAVRSAITRFFAEEIELALNG